ncbi:hypothetical protein PR202_gb04572 [Eleusine coracana subsp. coracana]|uniref:Uncharacterized protein n=1 Tax=Eleusine coracana subsp. coracana TaxID=191504 RepID=A0AAV5E3A0_ELECO|nr:hypothetical protein PR202_gb04572 [Eleusine coracana subsp. coracana]
MDVCRINVAGHDSDESCSLEAAGDVGNHGAPEVSGASEDGLRFANMVRQIMPFISQAETQHQSAAPDSTNTPLQASVVSVN